MELTSSMRADSKYCWAVLRASFSHILYSRDGQKTSKPSYKSSREMKQA